MSKPGELVLKDLRTVTMNLRVRCSRMLKWRIRLGLAIIRFGAWITSMGCVVHRMPDDWEEPSP